MRKLMVSALLLASLTGCGLNPMTPGTTTGQSALNGLSKRTGTIVTFAEATLKGIDTNGDRTITFAEYMTATGAGSGEYGGIGALLHMAAWGSLHALSRQTMFTFPEDADPKAILAEMKGQSFPITDLTKALKSEFFLTNVKTSVGASIAQQDRNNDGVLEPTELSADDWRELAPFDANKDKKISAAEYVEASLSVLSKDASTPAAVRLGQISMLATVKQ